MIKIKNNSYQQKPLGRYLVEAGLITPTQLQVALEAQKQENRRLGEILVQHGWVEKQSIENLMERVVIPERQDLWHNSKRKRYSQHKQVALTQYELSEEKNSASVALHQLEIAISASKILRLLISVVLVLLAAHLIGQFTIFFLPDYPLRDFFAEQLNLDRELNIPSFYSMLSLLVCAILLAVIAYAKQTAGDRFVRQWIVLSIIFFSLAVDEIMSFHEKITEPLRAALNTSGLLYYAWVIPGGVFVLVCLLIFWQFLSALPVKTRQLFILAGIIFITGAIGVELIGGYYAYLHSEQNMTYAVIASIEEVLEMFGVVLFIYGLLAYISSAMHGLNIQIQIVEPTQSARKCLVEDRRGT